MYNNEPYDLIGIGIGPFNLGLAAICAESTSLKCLFIEKNHEFNWHPGMLIDRARLQVPYYSDLVTLLNPKSRFSYMSYLHEKKKMFAFAIHDQPFILRKEYNAYCQWVAAQLDSCNFTNKCQEILYNTQDDLFEVHTGETPFRTRQLVIGTGTVPAFPACSKEIDHKMVFHSSNYVFMREELMAKKRLSIIGSGQSAAEIFYDLLSSAQQFDELRWYTRSQRLFPMDYSKFALQMATPAYIEEFFRLSPLKKEEVLRQQDALYKGINNDLLNTIYDELYLLREQQFNCKVEILPACELIGLTETKESIMAEVRNHNQETKFFFKTDAVILATGYQYKVPRFLNPIRELIRWRDDGYYDVQKNYAVDFRDRIFVQNADLYSHGFNSADLTLGPYRNAVILNSILGREQFVIENGKGLY